MKRKQLVWIIPSIIITFGLLILNYKMMSNVKELNNAIGLSDQLMSMEPEIRKEYKLNFKKLKQNAECSEMVDSLIKTSKYIQ